MNLLMMITFLYLIELSNSFNFVKSNSRIYKLNIYMGCDYYIEQNLYIHYNDNSVEYINVEREKAYYTDMRDNLNIINEEHDSIEYTNLQRDKYTEIYNNLKLEWEKIKQAHLEPKEPPLLIYINHTFINEYLSNKYSHRLEFEMINNDYKTWDDINKIILLEERYERY
jgi:hypothetical protein